MYGRLKDWRRVATRYDRCPEVFLSAIALAATVMLWLCVLILGVSHPIELRLCRSQLPNHGEMLAMTI
jgi:hypothetical protein